MDTMPSIATFETELGRCAVRWSDVGISGVLLPTAVGRPGPRFEHDEIEGAPGYGQQALFG